MTEQKQREDYPNNYEFMRENLWKEVSDIDDIKYANVISYFCKSGQTPITGEIKQIKETDYKATMGIKDAFQKIQVLMLTKSKTLRKSMEALTPYQTYDLIALLNYLREQWSEGNRGEVMLSWREYFLLNEGGFKKPKNKGKK